MTSVWLPISVSHWVPVAMNMAALACEKLGGDIDLIFMSEVDETDLGNLLDLPAA